MTTRFRPQLDALERRVTPTLDVLYTGSSLTLAGTPSATATQLLTVLNTGGENYKVTDGGVNLGTYHVARDINLKLSSYDCYVGVDLNGGTLGGSILIDVGAGDRDPATNNGVSVGTNAGAARVGGDVTFRNGAGTESFAVFADGPGSTLDVGGSVRAAGKPVAAPIEDTLVLSPQTHVHADVVTSRLTYTTIYGTVDGNVTANAIDSPGGMGFAVYGTVHGDVRATGGATAPVSADGTVWYSYAYVNGRVDGAVTISVTSGFAYVGAYSGSVGGDFRVNLSQAADAGRSSGVTMYGRVGGDTVIRSAGSLDADLSGVFDGDLTVTANGARTYLLNYGLTRGDFRYAGGSTTSSTLDIGGEVDGAAVVDLGGSAGTASSLLVEGSEYGVSLKGSLTVKSRAGTNAVRIGYSPDGTAQSGGVVDGDLTLDLGNGTNRFEFNGALGSRLGGKLTYKGGGGADVVFISGQNTFRAKLDLGGGDGSVSFAPDATLGGLDLDFGKLPGTKTWSPPTVITFPVKVKNLS